jgi:hypothetical protein
MRPSGSSRMCLLVVRRGSLLISHGYVSDSDPRLKWHRTSMAISSGANPGTFGTAVAWLGSHATGQPGPLQYFTQIRPMARPCSSPSPVGLHIRCKIADFHGDRRPAIACSGASTVAMPPGSRLWRVHFFGAREKERYDPSLVARSEPPRR